MIMAVQALGSGASDQGRASSLSQIVGASVIGTMVEWYDFLLYGTAAALVFNKIFFPSFDPFVGTLAAFGSYAVGFVARPLGGAIFGHFGDKIGRKTMLMLTMMIMGTGTFLIGCLPTYKQIGVWAPITLIGLRLLQGIGIGGEWGGATLMVIEHAPHGKRGFFGSLVQVGFPLGVATSTGVFRLVTQMPEEDFLNWGWRVPFLISIVLVGVGLFIRMRLSETPAFKRIQQSQAIAHRPLLEVIAQQPKAFLIAVGMKVSEVAWVYVLTVFSIVYATSKLGLPRAVILNGIVAAALLELLTIPLFGALSDRIGRKPMYIVGALLSAAIAFPIFWMLDTRDPPHPDHHRNRDEHHPWRNVWPAGGLYAGTVWDSCALQWRLTRLPDLGRPLRGIFSDYCRGALELGRRDLAGIALSRGAGIDYVDCGASVTRNRRGRHFADLNAGACQEDSFFGWRQRDVHDQLPEAAWTTAVFSAAQLPSSS
jgi:MHS family shikimate/dehydroshikimate transporter-like MFS transporter